MSGIDPEAWKRVEAVFDQALDRPAGERAAFLDRACAGDRDLRRQVQALLDAAGQASGFLEDGVEAALSGLPVGPGGVTLAPGHRVGPFRVVREIGRGGMGSSTSPSAPTDTSSSGSPSSSSGRKRPSLI